MSLQAPAQLGRQAGMNAPRAPRPKQEFQNPFEVKEIVLRLRPASRSYPHRELRNVTVIAFEGEMNRNAIITQALLEMPMSQHRRAKPGIQRGLLDRRDQAKACFRLKVHQRSRA